MLINLIRYQRRKIINKMFQKILKLNKYKYKITSKKIKLGLLKKRELIMNRSNQGCLIGLE